VLAHLCVRQTAIGASGLRKGDHIVDPRTGRPARGRRAAWVAVPRPEVSGAQAAVEPGPRVSAATVTDALTTAFMLMRVEEIEALCDRNPGLEAWILPEPAGGQQEQGHLLHFGGSRTGV
jgi:thiamine biosynthesis lipoprotein ApbE